MRTKSHRVLVVDDSLTVRMQVKEMLEAYGYTVSLAQNGHEGLEKITKERPHIILLDVMMPGMDGIEVCRIIKNDDRLKEIPVLIVTSITRVKEKIKGFQAGAEDYIVKPFVEEELLARIGAHVKTAHLLHQLKTEVAHRKQVEGALKEAGSELEQKVLQRTLELSKSNEELKTEIEERKRAEEHQNFYARILAFLNRSSDKNNSIRQILESIHDFSGFEAVGIRLQEGEDFPYYHTKGFASQFVKTERNLCAYDADGRLIRDPDGLAQLECMCGNIIRARFDSALPYYTENGSFWTNCASEFPHSAAEDKLVRKRRRCKMEGYESIALIPLHSGNKTIGLLQINDKRKGILTSELVAYYEGIGDCIGISLERQMAAEQLHRAYDELENKVALRTIELTRATQQAEAANAAKSDFLARMSHEIRTPISAVTGLTHLVLKTNLTAEQRNYLNKVQIASRNLLEVINDILDFSKVEAGRLELEHTPFDLNQVIERLTDLFSERVAEKDLELIFAMGFKGPRQLTGDPGRLTQVLTNLIENAVKYTEKGEIVVSMEVVAHNRENPTQTILQFRVSDTGIGVAADVQPTLFEPFTQAGGYLTRTHEGTGLGLAICRRLVELMGGSIEVESTPGKGSTFSFTGNFETRPEQNQPIHLPEPLRGLKTLVVDDSASARQVLGDMLTSFDFNVTVLDSGKKALEELCRTAATDPYQLVLLDWKMPDMDGLELAKSIRRQEPTPIIIMVTAYGHKIVRHSINTAVVDTLLHKPVKSSQLLETIKELFGWQETLIPGADRQPTARPAAQLAGRRILVVEDSELNRFVIVTLLEEAGIEVETAVNGQIAVDMLTRSPGGYYDAILMDIQMPLMDGYQATRLIRKNENSGSPGQPSEPTADQNNYKILMTTTRGGPVFHVPIIALTAHALKGEKEKCRAAGMDDYIAKPIEEEQLDNLLLKWINPLTAEPEQSLPATVETILDVAGALKRLGGKKHIYLKALKGFTPECDKADHIISQSLTAGDRQSAIRKAHTVKGIAATIGAQCLSQAAANLHKTIENNGSNIDKHMTGFKSELNLALEAVAGFLSTETD